MKIAKKSVALFAAILMVMSVLPFNVIAAVAAGQHDVSSAPALKEAGVNSLYMPVPVNELEADKDYILVAYPKAGSYTDRACAVSCDANGNVLKTIEVDATSPGSTITGPINTSEDVNKITWTLEGDAVNGWFFKNVYSGKYMAKKDSWYVTTVNAASDTGAKWGMEDGADISYTKILTNDSTSNDNYNYFRITATANTDFDTYSNATSFYFYMPLTYEQVNAKGVTIIPASLALAAGEAAQLTAVVEAENTEMPVSQSVVWSSSDPTVATVSASGTVEAQYKQGLTTITAKSVDGGFIATCIVNVSIVPVAAIVLSETMVPVYTGMVGYLKADVYPANATNKNIEWSTSNAELATVNEHGLVTIKGTAGIVAITATANDGSGIYATCDFTIVAKESVPFKSDIREAGSTFVDLQNGNNVVTNQFIGFGTQQFKHTITTTSGPAAEARDLRIVAYKFYMNKYDKATFVATSTSPSWNGAYRDMELYYDNNGTLEWVAYSGSSQQKISNYEADRPGTYYLLMSASMTASGYFGLEISYTRFIPDTMRGVYYEPVTEIVPGEKYVLVLASVSEESEQEEYIGSVLGVDTSNMETLGYADFAWVSPSGFSDAKFNGNFLNVSPDNNGVIWVLTEEGVFSNLDSVNVHKTDVLEADGSIFSLDRCDGGFALGIHYLFDGEIDEDFEYWMCSPTSWIDPRLDASITPPQLDEAGLAVFDVYRVVEDWTVAATVHVSHFDLNKTTLNLEIGETEQLTAAVFPSNASEKDILWWSDNPRVAAVDDEGNVKGVEFGGTATIWAISKDGGIIEKCTVTVAPPVEATAIELGSITPVRMSVGQLVQFIALTTPELNTLTYPELVWESSNEEILTVDPTGYVTAIAEGSASITVYQGTTKGEPVKASYTINVVADETELDCMSLSDLANSAQWVDYHAELNPILAPARAYMLTYERNEADVITFAHMYRIILNEGDILDVSLTSAANLTIEAFNSALEPIDVIEGPITAAEKGVYYILITGEDAAISGKYNFTTAYTPATIEYNNATYVLTDTLESCKTYIIVGGYTPSGGITSQYALSSERDNNTFKAVPVKLNGSFIGASATTLLGEDAALEWQVLGNDDEGYTIYNVSTGRYVNTSSSWLTTTTDRSNAMRWMYSTAVHGGGLYNASLNRWIRVYNATQFDPTGTAKDLYLYEKIDMPTEMDGDGTIYLTAGLNKNISIGQEFELDAGNTGRIVWRSFNSDVASVNSTGLVTGVLFGGQTEVHAMRIAEDGTWTMNGTRLNVGPYVPVEEIILRVDDDVLFDGILTIKAESSTYNRNNIQFVAEVVPANATYQELEWSAVGTGATINATTGLITTSTGTTGTTTITARVKVAAGVYEDVSATCNINVVSTAPKPIDFIDSATAIDLEHVTNVRLGLGTAPMVYYGRTNPTTGGGSILTYAKVYTFDLAEGETMAFAVSDNAEIAPVLTGMGVEIYDSEFKRVAPLEGSAATANVSYQSEDGGSYYLVVSSGSVLTNNTAGDVVITPTYTEAPPIAKFITDARVSELGNRVYVDISVNDAVEFSEGKLCVPFDNTVLEFNRAITGAVGYASGILGGENSDCVDVSFIMESPVTSVLRSGEEGNILIVTLVFDAIDDGTVSFTPETSDLYELQSEEIYEGPCKVIPSEEVDVTYIAPETKVFTAEAKQLEGTNRVIVEISADEAQELFAAFMQMSFNSAILNYIGISTADGVTLEDVGYEGGNSIAFGFYSSLEGEAVRSFPWDAEEFLDGVVVTLEFEVTASGTSRFLFEDLLSLGYNEYAEFEIFGDGLCIMLENPINLVVVRAPEVKFEYTAEALQDDEMVDVDVYIEDINELAILGGSVTLTYDAEALEYVDGVEAFAGVTITHVEGEITIEYESEDAVSGLLATLTFKICEYGETTFDFANIGEMIVEGGTVSSSECRGIKETIELIYNAKPVFTFEGTQEAGTNVLDVALKVNDDKDVLKGLVAFTYDVAKLEFVDYTPTVGIDVDVDVDEDNGVIVVEFEAETDTVISGATIVTFEFNSKLTADGTVEFNFIDASAIIILVEGNEEESDCRLVDADIDVKYNGTVEISTRWEFDPTNPEYVIVTLSVDPDSVPVYSIAFTMTWDPTVMDFPGTTWASFAAGMNSWTSLQGGPLTTGTGSIRTTTTYRYGTNTAGSTDAADIATYRFKVIGEGVTNLTIDTNPVVSYRTAEHVANYQAAVALAAGRYVLNNIAGIDTTGYLDAVLGDANDDGNVNSGDVSLILQYVIRMPQAVEMIHLKKADMNKDGVVNTGDASLLLWTLLNNDV